MNLIDPEHREFYIKLYDKKDKDEIFYHSDF